MKKSTLITLIVGVVIGVVACKLLWTAVQPKIEHRVEQIGLTENEKAANGPLPGDVSLYGKEFDLQQQIPTPGYFQSLNGAELADPAQWRLSGRDVHRLFRRPEQGLRLAQSGRRGAAQVAGIKLDQATGEMKTVFLVDDKTTCLVALIGPKDKRVMLTSNMHFDIPIEPDMLALGTANYKEQVRWRDAATGRLLAESDLFEPMAVNSLVTPGFGGRVYFPAVKGFIVMQAMPAKTK
jgi:hypothetical protein